MSNKCRSCNKQIKWITATSGKKMPVNAEEVIILPNEKGEYTILTIDGRVIKGDLTMAGTPGAIKGNVSHFSTCPNASDWRKK